VIAEPPAAEFVANWCAGLRHLQGATDLDAFETWRRLVAAGTSPVGSLPARDAVTSGLIEQATRLVNAKDYGGARAVYEAVVARTPADAEIRARLADTWWWTGAREKGFVHYHAAVALDPDCASAWRYLAQAQCQVGEVGAGLTSYGRAIEADPLDPGNWLLVRRLLADFKGTVRWRPFPWPTMRGNRLHVPTQDPGLDVTLALAYEMGRIPQPGGENSHPTPAREAAVLGRIRTGLEGALQVAAELQPYQGTPGPFWALVRSAVEHGLFEPTAFVLFMDADLCPHWRTWRARNAGVVTEFVRRQLLPALAPSVALGSGATPPPLTRSCRDPAVSATGALPRDATVPPGRPYAFGPPPDGPTEKTTVGTDTTLHAIKVLHTIAWAVFASAILALPVAAWRGAFHVAFGLIALVSVELVVLAVNDGSCPLTAVAARYTTERQPNFDIYLPVWLARWNKTIFGAILVGGLLLTGILWAQRTHG
jgi:hypothetical protein